jgi:hypothetical protein
MPLFYHRVEGVSPEHHGRMRLDRTPNFAFAAVAHTIPIGLGEFAAVAQHYPILFTAGPEPMPVALVGVNERGNLFVGSDGTWRKDTYVPAYVRAYPFILIDDDSTKTTYVGIEAGAASLSTTNGSRLFEDGKPTPLTQEMINFCTALRDNIRAGGLLARALDRAGLLHEEEATINLSRGGGARIRGFKVVRPELLDELPDATFLDWRHRRWLGPIYAQMHSSAQWANIVEVAGERGL